MPDIWLDVDAALSEVPVNIMPLLDDTDFKTRETGITYDQAGMDLVWNFVTSAGAMTQTAVTPTTGGDYDWAHQGDGMYSIEIPASGGASINNDTEGYGWFTGYATGVLPWRGPIVGFRDARAYSLGVAPLLDSAMLVSTTCSSTVRTLLLGAWLGRRCLPPPLMLLADCQSRMLGGWRWIPSTAWPYRLPPGAPSTAASPSVAR
jgi:hypothetical protein